MFLGQTQKIKTNNLTEVTLGKLRQIVREQKADPLVRKTIENIVGSVPEKDWNSEIEAITNFVKKSVRYTRDVNGIEYVKTPLRHLMELQTYGISYGDCDDMSLLLATLLESAGYKTRFVVIRTQSNPNNSFNHIYVEVLHPDTRKWLTLDATMKHKSYNWSPQYIMRKDYYN